MAKPTNLLAAYLRELPLTSEQKVQVYMLHIASKVDGGWFAAVTARKIGEQLDIDSAREVEAAIRAGGWEEHMGHVGRQAARGYIARVSDEKAVPKPKRPDFDALRAKLVPARTAPDAPPDEEARRAEFDALLVEADGNYVVAANRMEPKLDQMTAFAWAQESKTWHPDGVEYGVG